MLRFSFAILVGLTLACAGALAARPNVYNLADDAGQSRDLAPEEPEKLRALVAAWERLDREMVEPRW